jgi:hypothetical protein
MEAKVESTLKPSQWYSLKDIVQYRLFPWYSSFEYVRKVVKKDYQNRNILKAVITGEGTNRKYQIKGENIIKFIKSVENGKVTL